MVDGNTDRSNMVCSIAISVLWDSFCRSLRCSALSLFRLLDLRCCLFRRPALLFLYFWRFMRFLVEEAEEVLDVDDDDDEDESVDDTDSGDEDVDEEVDETSVDPPDDGGVVFC